MTGLALGLCAAWGLWTTQVWWRHRQPLTKRDALPPVLVAYASQTGTARALALQQQQALGGAQQVALLSLAELRPEQLAQVQKAVFVVSTYGDGEPPDNGRRFYHDLLRLTEQRLPLSTLNYEVLALGDRRYPKFCQFGEDLYQQLARLGATAASDLRKVDQSFDHNQTTATATAARQGWRLVSRERINTAADAGLFHLRLQPKERCPSWRAGDVVAVYPGGGAAPRKYSIASAPGDQQLHLIVRQHVTENGTLGLCSGWLTRDAALMDEIQLEIIENPVCHIDAHGQPLLLIGAGSGLAGLRGHLAERAQQRLQHRKAGPTWMIYGERSADPSQGLMAELEHWQQNGTLSQLDYACSRELRQPAYVQDLVKQQGQQIRTFLGRHGHIYLCGRYEGMGTAVDAALRIALGAEAYQQLLEAGRYHRDLY